MTIRYQWQQGSGNQQKLSIEISQVTAGILTLLDHILDWCVKQF